MDEGFRPDSATTSDLAKSIERVLADEGPWEELRDFQEKYGDWIGRSHLRFGANDRRPTAPPNDAYITQRMRDDLSRLGMVEMDTTTVRWIRVEPKRRLRDAADDLPLRTSTWLNALERYHTAWDASVVYDDRDAGRVAREERRRSRKAMLAAAERAGFTWNGYERRFAASWRWKLNAVLVPTFMVASIGGASAATVAAVTATNGSERAGYLAVVAASASVFVTILVARR